MRLLPYPAALILSWLLAVVGTARAADPVEGLWTGTVTSPQGEAAELGLDFYRTRQGALTFRLHFPAMFTYGAALGLPVESDGAGGYAITPVFDLKLRLQGDRLVGTFGTAALPVDLHRGGQPTAQPGMPLYPPAPAPAWRYPLGAGTWAPPLAADGVIYLGAANGRFHAVQAKDGRAAWVWPGDIPIDGRAAVDAERVYFVDTRCNLVALDRQTGALRWRTPLHNEFLAGQSPPDNPTFNHRAATPLVLDGVVYAGSSDGGLYALQPASGAVLWRHAAGAPVYSGVGVLGTDTLLFGAMDGSVVALDRRTRREALRTKTGGGVVTTPVVAAGRLVVGSRDYLIHAFDAATGAPAWRFSYWFSWIESTPVLRDGLLYVGGSDFARVSALDPATGRARWSTVVHGLTWGSPLVTERAVFAGTVAQNVPGTLIAHQAGLVKLDRVTGAVLWRLALPDAPEGQFAGYAGGPALSDGLVVVAGLDGTLAAFPAE